MAHDVDGFVVPVPKRNLKKYLAMARKALKPGEVVFLSGKRMFFGGFKTAVELA